MSKYESFSDDAEGKSRWLLPLLLVTALVGAFYMELPQKVWPPLQAMLGLAEEDQTAASLPLLPSPDASRMESSEPDRFEQAHQTALEAMKTPNAMQKKPPSTGDELLDMESLINDKLNQLSRTQHNREGLKEEISDLQVEIEQSNQRVAKKEQRLKSLETR